MQRRYDFVQCHVVRIGPAGPEFLQLRRAPGEFMAGTWQLINGKIEPGETAWQAALRELAEETALKPLEFYQLDTLNVFYLAKDDAIWHCPGFCAVVRLDAVPQLNEEHDAFRWITREQLEQSLMWPGERLAAAELCREIIDNGPARPYLRISLE